MSGSEAVEAGFICLWSWERVKEEPGRFGGGLYTVTADPTIETHPRVAPSFGATLRRRSPLVQCHIRNSTRPVRHSGAWIRAIVTPLAVKLVLQLLWVRRGVQGAGQVGWAIG